MANEKKVPPKNSPSADLKWMSVAFQVSWVSRDPKEQCGAVVVASHKIKPISIGVNEKIEPITNEKELCWASPSRKVWMNSAAINAIAGINDLPANSKIYLTHAPCVHSTKAILTRGIRSITYALVPDWYTEEEMTAVKELCNLSHTTISKFEGNLNWARDKWEALTEMMQ